MIALACVLVVCLTALAGTYMVLHHDEPKIKPEHLGRLSDEQVNIWRTIKMQEDRLAKLEELEAQREAAKNLVKGLKL